MKIKILFPLIILFLIFNFTDSASAGSGWIIYHESAFKGKVIDTETKEPIEGAVVVAIYRIREYSFVESNTMAKDVKEVLTNKNGEFYIPSHTFLSFYPIAKGEAPAFIIYKPGYSTFGGLYYYNYFPDSPLREDIYTLAEFFKKGVTVELMRLKTKEERLDNIPSSPTDMRSKKLPLLYRAINKENKRFGLGEIK